MCIVYSMTNANTCIRKRWRRMTVVGFTAIAGEDANWGRVVMAVGKAGEEADRDRLSIWFGDVRVAINGERDPGYSEEAASLVMKKQEIDITVDLGLDQGSATIWTCDLTHDYIAINADYRS